MRWARSERSRYLQLIAGAIFVSVAVSTLIDFQFKAAAKTAYPSQDGLTAFFGSYYAWVAIITFFSQVVLTRKASNRLRLDPESLPPSCGSVRRISGYFGLAGTFLHDSDATDRCSFAHKCEPERHGDTLSSSLCEL